MLSELGRVRPVAVIVAEPVGPGEGVPIGIKTDQQSAR